jgi:hypothetical protein
MKKTYYFIIVENIVLETILKNKNSTEKESLKTMIN